MKNIHWNIHGVFLLVLLITVFMSCQTPCKPRIEVEETIPQKVLKYALNKVDSPYVWEGQGPYEFDCSGIIICAYAEALHASYFLVNMNDELCDDVTMDVLYKKNGATGFCVGQFTKVSAGTIESPPL